MENGHSERATLQIVNEDQEFTTELDGYMKESWKLYDTGFSYDVIAVFGSQSTGKSTLLNGVFGTGFDVMQSERRQTTKGIWMAKAQGANLLVMDVEGTDGRERGEDQEFERKSALFSMASAEVLLVNLWEHQIGLYQGANMGLLKTVFEVNLSLFQSSKSASQGKTLLLFVIRDHIGATPLENLKNTLLADLNKLWDSLSKPENTASSRITDYFDMAFATLPHKLLQPEKFETELVQLRQRFFDSKDPDYVFKPAYHKRVPADGCAHYMAGIWEQVLTNKDLDLPTQQELLAQFRCDEIASAAFLLFETSVKQFASPIASGQLLATLGEGMKVARVLALTTFDKEASRYNPAVYQRKRAELVAKANSTLAPLFVGQLQNLHKSVLVEFKHELTASLRKESYDFGNVLTTTKAKAEERYQKEAAAILLDETDWSWTESFARLQEEMASIADTCRVEETKKMVIHIERTLKQQIAAPVELALNKPSLTMWDSILIAFKDALAKAEATYIRKANSFNCTEEENNTAVAALRKRAWISLTDKIQEQTIDSNMLIKLKLFFEDKFRYDSDGVPRIWKPSDDIDGLFKQAKEETLDLIPLFSRIKPSDSSLSFKLQSDEAEDLVAEDAEFDFDESLIILTEGKQDNLATRFRREADAYYIEAKRSLISSISQIPTWIYVILALLGWNEFIAVLRSPLYFTTVALLLGLAYAVYAMNMAGPVLTIATGTYNTAVAVATEKLREQFAPALAPPEVIAMEVRPRKKSQ